MQNKYPPKELKGNGVLECRCEASSFSLFSLGEQINTHRSEMKEERRNTSAKHPLSLFFLWAKKNTHRSGKKEERRNTDAKHPLSLFFLRAKKIHIALERKRKGEIQMRRMPFFLFSQDKKIFFIWYQ
jgi:hypothetical protein